MMNIRAGSVSVIITCYNEGSFIEDTLKSVLQQSAEKLIADIVIADDGSDIETIDVLKRIETLDPRIEVIYGSGGAGLPAQRNRAIARSKGELLAFLDGDDLWVPSKLSDQLPIFEIDPTIGLVYSDFFIFSSGDVSTAWKAGVIDITGSRDLMRTYFLNDPPIIPSTIIVRRSHYFESGGFDNDIRVFEDTDFYIKMSRICRFGIINAPLIYKRNHKKSITGSRKDLMAHHAYVAFKAASRDVRLLELVPNRLSERARKLGNQRFIEGEKNEATSLLKLSVKLNRMNIKALLYFIIIRFIPNISLLVMKNNVIKRRSALGVNNVE